mgnify:CR=1 FL=1
MSYLSNLYWNLSNLESQKSGIEAELNNLINRRSDLESLIKNLFSVGDNNYLKVNKYANRIIDKLSDSLKGIRSILSILNSVSAELEKVVVLMKRCQML